MPAAGYSRSRLNRMDDCSGAWSVGESGAWVTRYRENIQWLEHGPAHLQGIIGVERLQGLQGTAYDVVDRPSTLRVLSPKTWT